MDCLLICPINQLINYPARHLAVIDLGMQLFIQVSKSFNSQMHHSSLNGIYFLEAIELQ